MKLRPRTVMVTLKRYRVIVSFLFLYLVFVIATKGLGT